eukprot:CAMPEP_0178395806 /NCGR_PEP_ID=MMETSP0689_2-20121128/13407_1 /TAXON_ID=160604 /ORGANISM="Amphidinium massartii, Strain CS-259" /LENGTH=156 /DNA_ID=CAMNT_0020016469 /DNA_START=189 /DNA_END=661 /DNA_ORIENTATION=-
MMQGAGVSSRASRSRDLTAEEDGLSASIGAWREVWLEPDLASPPEGIPAGGIETVAWYSATDPRPKDADLVPAAALEELPKPLAVSVLGDGLAEEALDPLEEGQSAAMANVAASLLASEWPADKRWHSGLKEGAQLLWARHQTAQASEQLQHVTLG